MLLSLHSSISSPRVIVIDASELVEEERWEGSRPLLNTEIPVLWVEKFRVQVLIKRTIATRHLSC